MKKTISRVAVAMLLAQTFSPVATYAHNDQVSNVLEVTSTNGSIVESLTSNQWLRQIVVVTEDVDQAAAQEIVNQLEGYTNNLLQGLAINRAKIQIVETLDGLNVLPEGTNGAELNSYLTQNNVLYLKAKPSENTGSAHFALQQAALLMNQTIFENIFSSKDYQDYYSYDKDSVSYGNLSLVDFMGESLGYYAYEDYSLTEVYKAEYTRYYLYYLIAGYQPKVVVTTPVDTNVIDSLTDNTVLRQIVFVPETVDSDVAKGIVNQIAGYGGHLLQGLLINKAQIQILNTLEGLNVLPEGTNGAELNSYLAKNNVLYLKAQPSEDNGSAHFALQQTALLMNQAIFNDIFSTADYRSYYYADKDTVSYSHLNQLDFIAESFGYFAYADYSQTEVYKAIYLRYYLYYLIADYVPKEVFPSEQYLNKIIEYPTVAYDQEAAKAITSKLELFDIKYLEALALNGAKLKLVNKIDENTPAAKQNELIIEIGKDYSNDWSYDELLRQIVLWVDASLWYSTAQSLDFKYVYDYSYAEREFAKNTELTQEEFFSEAIVLRLNKKLTSTGKMGPVSWYIYYLLRDYKPRTIDYNEEFEIDPIEISEEENALLDELIPQVVEVTAGATDYDVAEVERIIERLKRYGAEVFQGMIYSEIKIRLTTGPITDEPEMDYLADVTPRGWPDDLTWADVPGAGGNPVFSRIGHSYMGMGHSTVNLEHHETAHILDYYLFDYVSISDEFVALHEKEAVSLYGNDGYMEFYPEEYFAEALTFYFLSGHKRAMLKRLAPETYEFIDNLYSNYKAVDPFDSVVDAEKTSYINKILVIDTNDAEAKEYAIKSLKRIDTNFLKALARLNIKYSLSTLGKFESLEKITTVNPILNHVARDVEKYVLNNATESEEFKKVFEEEGGVVNQPKTPKSLFVYQEFIANDIKEFFAETFAMYYQSGGTRYDLGAKAPGAWIFIEDADIALNNQPPVDDGGSTPNPNPGDDDGGSTPNPNPGDDGGSTLIPNPGGGSSTGGSGNTSGSTTGETTSPKIETTTTETVLDNGTIIKETIHENGEKVVIIETTNGSKSETTISAAGEFIASIAISAKELTQAGNQPIVLPIPEVKVSNDIATAPIIKLTAVNNDETAPVKVIVPVQNVSVGTVIMIVHEDGTTEVIKKTKFSNGQLTFEAYPNVTYKVVDNSKSFDDVEATSWYSDAVQYAAAREWVKGTDEKGFSPNSTLTREQFVTILHRISNADSASLASVAYNDVDSDAYYADAVKWAKDSGIMTGQSDGSFGIGQAISREDFAVVLWRSVGSPSEVSTPENFTDFNNTSGYAIHALAWAVENGLFLGKGDGRLDPKGSATRAEATKLLMYFEENILK